MLYLARTKKVTLLGCFFTCLMATTSYGQTVVQQQQVVPQPVYPQVQQVYPQMVPMPQYQMQPMQVVPVPSMMGAPTVTYQQVPIPNYQMNPYMTAPQLSPYGQQVPMVHQQQQIHPQQQAVQQQNIQQPAPPQEAPQPEPEEIVEEAPKEQVQEIAESKIFKNESIDKPRKKAVLLEDDKHFSFSSRDVVVAKENKKNFSNADLDLTASSRIKLPRGTTNVASATQAVAPEAIPTPKTVEKIGTTAARKSYKPVSMQAEQAPNLEAEAETSKTINLNPLLDPTLDFESCTKVVSKNSAGSSGSCFKITMAHSCNASRYLVMCSHTSSKDGCRMSDRPVPPNTQYDFMLCLPNNFLLRHAACSTIEGCENFKKKSAPL